MNFYKRHLGDYARDTGHLTPLQHGIYTLLLDYYYATEKPIPRANLHRVARARTPEERRAADAVGNEFFEADGPVLRNKRVESEIHKFLDKSNKARDASALRWHSDGNAIQNPESRIQKKAKEEEKIGEAALRATTTKRGERLQADWTCPEEWGHWARSDRPGVDVELEAAKFRDHWIAAAGRGATKLDWFATWRNWIRSSRSPLTQVATKPKQAHPCEHRADGRPCTDENTTYAGGKWVCHEHHPAVLRANAELKPVSNVVINLASMLKVAQ